MVQPTPTSVASLGAPVKPIAPGPGAFVSGPGGLRATIKGDHVLVTHQHGATVTLMGHRNDVTSVAFSSDAALVVTASKDRDARIWDARTGELVKALVGPFGIVSDARFSPERPLGGHGRPDHGRAAERLGRSARLPAPGA